jgi:uncharacterized protein (DUF362 family)
MVNKALFTITGKDSEKDAWTSLGVTPQDVVGIKVNCNTWTFLLNTHSELVYALCDTLKTVVKDNNIIIYERKTSELSRSGYQLNMGATGIRCFGNDDGGGYDAVENLTRIVTDKCTKIINFPSLKCVEGEFGGSLFLKNHIGSLKDDLMSRCHGDAEYCTETCALPSIRKKTVLAICDGLRGTYKRGVPWYWGGIIMSRDPIAAEYKGLTILNEKRKLENERELVLINYIKEAEIKYRLGTCDPAKIETVKIEM